MDTELEAGYTFLADEVDDLPPPAQSYPVSVQHTIPDVSSRQDLDPNGLQRRGQDHVSQKNGSTVSVDQQREDTYTTNSNKGKASTASAQFLASTEEYFRNLRQERETEATQQEQMQEDSEAENPQDSLSLGQLKKLLQDMPKSEPTPYAFEYADTSSFEEELEELFDYSVEERETLLRAQKTFTQRWIDFKASQSGKHQVYTNHNMNWHYGETTSKIKFLHLLKAELLGDNESARISALDCAVYLALGSWLETATQGVHEEVNEEELEMEEDPYFQAKAHVAEIRANLQMIGDEIGIDTVYQILRQTYADKEDELISEKRQSNATLEKQDNNERWSTLILLYLFVDIGRRNDLDHKDPRLRNLVLALEPNFLSFLSSILVQSRWDDTGDVPISKLLLLFWKTILLFFGGTTEIKNIKDQFGAANGLPEATSGPLITASPLDYHMFRQELISKYPAFNPPHPLFPFEPETSSILPPLQDYTSRSNSISSVSDAGPANVQGAGTSIMQLPVHIATPAPSPPPSPAGPGGKGIKKQNYQTNQMFPFLYPPLDQSSNDLGGKGSTELQDLLAGRKWMGSDIPASILEAADLFSKRMRATRAMRQLWEERVRFLKFERGYDPGDDPSRPPKNDSIDEERDPDLALLDDDLRARLLAVELFYQDALPRLQSLVMVLLKVLLMAVTTLITQPHGMDGLRNGEPAADLDGHAKTGAAAQLYGSSGADDGRSLNDLVALRAQEIMGKAVSGILLLLLKWFKLSHILKFEYFSQLLLDSSYVQCILKLFTHQELERAVTYKCQRRELNFFALCRSFAYEANDTGIGGAKKGVEAAWDALEADVDDAEPPPIRMARPSETQELGKAPPNGRPKGASFSTPEPPLLQPQRQPPEVDELGYAVSDLPASPLTRYSWRTFFTSINNLRILQKLVKAKPHRQLLMVQSKYSLTLKKHLKVPQHDIRLYTLKIIKGQVPYCHRKWRASNMRIITAIYLHVKPGLRDEWLSGLDVEQEVGEALPLEQALRALTFWWHLRMYPKEFGVESGMVEANSEVNDELDDLDLDEDVSNAGSGAEPRTCNDQPSVAAEGLVEDDALNATTTTNDNNDAQSFDVDYDPFATSQSPPAFRASPMPNPPIGAPASTTRRTSTSHLTASEEDDFFLRELEKMDLNAAFAAGETEASQDQHTQPPQHVYDAVSVDPPANRRGEYRSSYDPSPGYAQSRMQPQESASHYPAGSGMQMDGGLASRHGMRSAHPSTSIEADAEFSEAIAAFAFDEDAEISEAEEAEENMPPLEGTLDEHGNVVIQPQSLGEEMRGEYRGG